MALLALPNETEARGAAVRFDIILADPPWRYEHIRTKSRRVENHYPTMTVGDIAVLPIASIAADDAVLFMWATNPKLPEALHVMASWGFTYRTSAVWVKPQMGMGYYFRAQHEPLLLGVRGKMRPPPPAARPRSVINAPRQRHSQKPESVYTLIEGMFPDASRVELFARARRGGWASWGNEIAPDITLGAA